MLKLIFLSFCLLTVQTAIDPRALEDEVLAELEQLRSLVKGEISAAEDEIDAQHTDLLIHSNNVQAAGELAIQLEYEIVAAELITIRNLAQDAGKDISYCTSGREGMIHSLNDEVKGRIRTGIALTNSEGSYQADDTRYIVDTTINRVNGLEFDLERCNGEILCISPVQTQIAREMSGLPQEIKDEVVKLSGHIGDLKALVQQISDSNVGDFSGYVNPLLEQISTCADRILGGWNPFPPPNTPRPPNVPHSI